MNSRDHNTPKLKRRKYLPLLHRYAVSFNGVDEYLTLPLPNNDLLASPGVGDFYSSGSAIAGWDGVDVIWNSGVSGKTYTETITIPADKALSKTIVSLIVGQKYKFKCRYQAGTDGLSVGSGIGSYFVLPDTFSEWNTVSKIFTAESTLLTFDAPASGACILDWASVKRDQGFDANKDQEMILHSRNTNFNNAGCDWVGNGNHSIAVTGGCLVITASGAGDENTNYVELPLEFIESCLCDKKYILESFAKSDTATTTLTIKLGSKTVTSANLSTSTVFTKAVLNLLATATEEGVPVKAWLNKAAVVSVDSFSLTQAFDLWVSSKNITDRTVALVNMVFGNGGNDTADTGFGFWYFNGNNSTRIADDKSGVLISTSNTTTSWQNGCLLINRTDKIAHYTNGVKGSESLITSIGKILQPRTFVIGRREQSGSYWFNGQIGVIQIIRFDNIALTDFNPNTYQPGHAITDLGGGVPEVVLHLDPKDGSSVANMLKDYSPKGHTITAINIDLSNRVVVRN